MTFEQLRLKHPRFVYKTYTITQDDSGITITYEFLLEPDIVFRPRVMIPIPARLRENFGEARVGEMFVPYVFNLGMVEAISYWKAACPREFVVEAGALSKEQVRFWHDLFIHGLGEFYYTNTIDFTVPDFLRISSPVIPASEPGSNGEKEWIPDLVRNDRQTGDLLLVGGGKDSAVTLGILKGSSVAIQTMILNPTQAALDIVQAAGYKNPIVVKRELDLQLIALNKKGYLNGHTPFSAYLGFLGITVAYLYNYGRVIVSNEKSANEGNVMYLGTEINHQYSKSFRFEQMFRSYVQDAFDNVPSYFSLLRPLNDLQIALIFSKHPEFFTIFRSCNVGSKTNSWCGTCPKCAFTYLILSPFLSPEQLVISFGADLFQNDQIIAHIRALVGLSPVKPFECVGTRDEATLAVLLSVEKYMREGREVPEGLLKIKSDLAISSDRMIELRHKVLDEWGDIYNLPDDYLMLLKKAWEEATHE